MMILKLQMLFANDSKGTKFDYDKRLVYYVITGNIIEFLITKCFNYNYNCTVIDNDSVWHKN